MMRARVACRLALWAPLVAGAAHTAPAVAAGSFTFKAQVLHERLGPMKRFTLTVDGRSTITDDGGVLEVPLATGTTHVVVAVAGPDYAIHYPFGGFVAVPRDLRDMPQIVVGSPKGNEYLRQYISIYQMTKRGAARQGEEMAALDRKLADLQDLLLKLHYSDADLRAAKEIQDRKDDYFPEITADLADFKTRAWDLKTAFKDTAELAFDNPNALERLQEAVVNYNATRNKLQRQRSTYQKRVADYWQDPALTADFQRLMSVDLDKIHFEKIYPMQPIIADIRRYFIGKDHDRDLRKRIQGDIATRVKDLEAALPEMDTLTAKVLGELAQ
jgi:hypothetical protein